MTTYWFFVLCAFSVIACALVSGVFLAFSSFIMRSLNNAKSSAGIEVMQIINREVWPTLFITLLLIMSALSPVLVGYAYFHLGGAVFNLISIGGIAYFIGTFMVSLTFNVPMNNRLDAKEFSSADATVYWTTTYIPHWTFWNYVRAASSACAAICYLMVCILLSQS